MAQYFITNHRTVWDGEKHVYVCDIIRFDGWTVIPVRVDVKQIEAEGIIRKLKAQQEEVQ